MVSPATEALRNLAKFTGKHPCQSLLLNKVAGYESKIHFLSIIACNSIKKETLAQVLSCELCKISQNTFFYRTPPVAVSKTIALS